jgi:hypothetical protein
MHSETETTSAIGPAQRPVESPSRLTLRQRRQIGLITLGAIGVFAFLRWLPTGTNLSHMDFRVDAKNPIDFCDPLNPQFIPVVAVPSPVTMVLQPARARAGEPLRAMVRLKTASGKPIAPADLLVVHTERLHLLIVDPTLTDYQHVHPNPGEVPGEWEFGFTPRRAGAYRVFADFTPAATSRGLYASADLQVAEGPGGRSSAPAAGGTTDPTGSSEEGATTALRGPGPAGASGGAGATATLTAGAPALEIEHDGYQFRLVPGAWPLRARTPVDLKFSVRRPGGGGVPMQPVMGAFAHLVAFDQARSGFAHLHPAQSDLLQSPDPQHPVLDFKITIPQPGRYVIWAQVNLAGREVFVPFWIEVT